MSKKANKNEVAPRAGDKTFQSLADLTPDPANARKHNPRNVGMLVDSLHQVGAARSIVVDENGVVLAGNATIEAAAEAGIHRVKTVEADGSEIVAVVRRGLSKEQKTKLALYDNRVAELAEWNPDILAELTETPALEGMFSDKELAEILTQTGIEPKDAEPQIDKAKELGQKWGTETGQLWVIGNHRLLVGDATNKEDVGRVCATDRLNLVVTSPPYNQKIDGFKPSGMHTETRWVKNVQEGSYADSRPESEYQAEQAAVLGLWASFLSKDASIFYNHKNRYRDKQVVSPWRWVEIAGAKVRQEIIWKREGSVTQNARMFLPCDERVFWLYFGDDFYFDDSTEIKTWSSVWEINSHKDIGHSEHGCAFPMELPLRCIRACSRVGDVVLEPYAGSGTTLVAAENLNRKCYAMEISPAYVAVCLERMTTAFPHLKIEKVDQARAA